MQVKATGGDDLRVAQPTWTLPHGRRQERSSGMDDRASAPLPARSLLDAGRVPVVELSQFAHREARRPRPIYGAHKWFARRLGTAFRSLLVAAATPDDGDFWDAYYGGADLRDLTVLDTFVGGGTALVEAQRLGATVIGLDVDPVAAAVTRFELGAAEQPDPERVLTKLQQKVASKLAPYHQVANNADSRGAPAETVVHHFWVQEVGCSGCDSTLRAHPTWQIAANAAAGTQHVLCRHCGTILQRPLGRDRVRCGSCRRDTVVAAGPVSNGKISCESCGIVERLIGVAERTGQPPRWHLFALEVIAADGTRRRSMRQRHFRAATDADRALVEAAAAALADRDPKYLPATKIPINRVDDRVIRYGYRQYRDLFNPRQLLHLSVLAEAILELPADERHVAALAFSNHLTTTCMLTSYAAGWRRLVPLFSIRAYRHVPRPVEVNPWLDGTGRGTYPNALRQVAAAIDFAKQPREFTCDGFRPVPAVPPSTPGRVLCQSSEDLSAIPSASVSLVLSDPPYLDNIAYSELSDFFAPWLRLLRITNGTPVDRARKTNLAAGGRSADAAAVFSQRLGRCFREASRVLAPGGRVVFTYQHATATGWHSLGQALATAELTPVNVIPLQGDGGFGLHAHDGSSIFDAILILQPRKSASADVPATGHQVEAAGEAPLPELTLTRCAEKRARKAARAWATDLGEHLPAVFREPDRVNLLRAHLVAAALTEQPGNGRTSACARPLLEALHEVADDEATATIHNQTLQGA